MAWTYATLSQMIQDVCEEDETSFVNNIPNFVRAAEDRILNAAQLPVFRKHCEGTLTADNRFLSVPTDYLTPYSVAIDNSGAEYLILKDVSWIREVYPDKTATGTPKYYATFSEESLLLGPTPDSNYTVELHYFYRPDSIVDSSTSWLGTNAESCLEYACLVEAYIYLKGEADVLSMYNDRYQVAITELKDLAEGYAQTDNYRGGTPRVARR